MFKSIAGIVIFGLTASIGAFGVMKPDAYSSCVKKIFPRFPTEGFLAFGTNSQPWGFLILGTLGVIAAIKSLF